MKPIWLIITVVVVALFLWACNKTKGNARISGVDARAAVAEGATLLDVRTPGEYEGGHIDQAVNIPVADLGRRVDEVSKDKPVVVYCASGGRSARAAGLLREAGYTVHDLGPMSAW